MRRIAWPLALVLGCSGSSLGCSGSSLGCSGSSPAASPAPASAVATAAYECNASSGLAPASLCSASAPCTSLLPIIADRGPISTGSDVPTCTAPSSRGGFVDGAPRSRVDADGVTRYACVFVPEAASATAPVPLVLFFHGAGGSADNVYGLTSLRRKAASYPLHDAPGATPGFALVSIQGRNLHWPTDDARDGPHHDIYHRDLASPSTNLDIANADALVDTMVEGGRVDPARIYVVGWSNGGFFAELYGIARHDTATPGGNRIAGVAVYSAADPFRSPRAVDHGRCDLSPVPRTDVPIAIVSRTCDVVACDAAQAEGLALSPGGAQPGTAVRTWTDRARGELGDPNVSWRMVNALGYEATQCTIAPMCGLQAALMDHVRWPDGVSDESHLDHEPFMLDYLRTHTGS